MGAAPRLQLKSADLATRADLAILLMHVHDVHLKKKKKR